MNELHVVVIVSQVPEFVCKQLRKTVTKNKASAGIDISQQHSSNDFILLEIKL